MAGKRAQEKKRRRRRRKEKQRTAPLPPEERNRYQTMRRLKQGVSRLRNRANMVGLLVGLQCFMVAPFTDKMFAIMLVAAPLGYIASLVYGFGTRHYLTSLFKKYVLRSFLAERFPGLEYNPRFACDEQKVLDSALIHVNKPRLTATDGLFGARKGMDVEVMELIVRSSAGVSIGRPLYRGVYAAMKLTKRIEAGVLIFSHDYPLRPSKLYSELDRGGGFHKVTLELEAFNQTFDVWTTNEVECRVLLPLTFQERLVEVHQAVDKGLALSIVGDQMAITYGTDVDLFEPDPADYTSRAQLEVSARQVDTIIDVLKMLMP